MQFGVRASVVALAALAFGACASSPAQRFGSDVAPAGTATEVVAPEPRTEAFEATAKEGCALIEAFARQHAWHGKMSDCFYDSVEVFSSQDELKRRLIELHDLPPTTKLPSGVVAALEKRILMAVSADEMRRLNPAYSQHDDSWTRLLAHEIAHRLHVAILDGDEDAMGPTWFFEGFAVVASGQRLGEPLTYPTAKEALAGAHEKAPLAYRRFAAAVRYFAEKAPLAELVKRAGDEDFEAWLLSLDDEA